MTSGAKLMTPNQSFLQKWPTKEGIGDTVLGFLPNAREICFGRNQLDERYMLEWIFSMLVWLYKF